MIEYQKILHDLYLAKIGTESKWPSRTSFISLHIVVKVFA